MRMAIPSWRRLLRHLVRLALSLALLNAGKSIAAKMAMMAMTTSSSIKVNPLEADARFISAHHTFVRLG